MTFNWFKRSQQQSPSPQAEPESPPQPAVEQAPEAPSTTEPAAPAIDQDYLAWAKAAYKNIQQKQAAQGAEQPAAEESAAASTTETTAEPTEESPAEPNLEPVAESVSAEVPPEVVTPLEEAPPSPIAEASVLEGSATPEVSDVLQSTEAAADSQFPEEEIAPAPETVEAPAPEPTPVPLPFWAKAEAERQERLERLREAAAAFAEAAPEAPAVQAETEQTAVVTEEMTTEETDPMLDEGFLWSAKVLAAQGRRADQIDVEEITWLKRLRQGLDKTRRGLVNQLRAIVGQGPLNQDAVMEIESLLLQADVGVEATDYIIEALQTKVRQEALPPEQAIAYLKEILRGMLDRPYEKYAPTFAPDKDTLNIWLITGVNGAGKTTTIGKIAHVASKSGYRCLIGAADTFRAAAVQQVKVWGDRSSVDVIANPGKNTDPAAVVFDAITAAQSRGTELLLIDTAGRLQNKKNLMDELGKMRRIIDKKAPNAKIESLLVLDSTLGQNGLKQAEVFSDVAQLSGVILTKLDGTAKGGIALAVVQQLGLPIRFIGAGEGIEDLRPFSSYEFVEALLSG